MTTRRGISFSALAIAAALSGLLGLPGAAAAQGSETPHKPAARPSPHADTLRKGAQWDNTGTAYAVVPEVRAVTSASKDETPTAAMARHGVTGGSLVEQKGGFVLYKESAAPRPLSGSGTPTPLLAAKADPRPVVMNMRTKQLAVVLNSIRVELQDITAADTLATEMGITLGRQFPNRPIVYYAVPAGMDLINLVTRLRSDARVAKADIELVEFVRTAY
ncbi:MAG TPA: hypothetical protein VF678_08185 [bacterium]